MMAAFLLPFNNVSFQALLCHAMHSLKRWIQAAYG